jgi:hypothetical protein
MVIWRLLETGVVQITDFRANERNSICPEGSYFDIVPF